jgi:hypothetical protein
MAVRARTFAGVGKSRTDNHEKTNKSRQVRKISACEIMGERDIILGLQS